VSIPSLLWDRKRMEADPQHVLASWRQQSWCCVQHRVHRLQPGELIAWNSSQQTTCYSSRLWRWQNCWLLSSLYLVKVMTKHQVSCFKRYFDLRRRLRLELNIVHTLKNAIEFLSLCVAHSAVLAMWLLTWPSSRDQKQLTKVWFNLLFLDIFAFWCENKHPQSYKF